MPTVKLSVIIAVSSAIDNLVMDYGSLAGEVFPDVGEIGV